MAGSSCGSSCGVIYVATGARYAEEAARSVATLRRHEPDLAATLFTDATGDYPGFSEIVRIEDHRNHPRKGSYGKVEHIGRSPYERTLYLDTDTYVCGTIHEAFLLLERFEFLGVHAPNRIVKRHEEMPQRVPGSFAQLNGGVLLFRRCARTDAILAEWLKRYSAQDHPRYFGDQHSLREVLWDSGVHLGVLSTEWNCRFHYGVTVHGPVRILHGRHRRMDLVERRINAEPWRVRTFRRSDFRPLRLHAWCRIQALLRRGPALAGSGGTRPGGGAPARRDTRASAEDAGSR
jgi:hypothetical protein